MNIKPDERIDFIIDKDIQIIQSQSIFSYSIDSVLLALFAKVPNKPGTVYDFCTGTGVIPLLLTKWTDSKIIGLEIQKRLANMAKRSVELNQLTDQVEILNKDILEFEKVMPNEGADLITCNPPYFKRKVGQEINTNEHLAIARHEIYCTFEDIARISRKLLKSGGTLAVVHRAERLIELLETMRKYNIEPKRIRYIHPKRDKNASVVLIEGKKNGKPELRVQPPIFVYNEHNEYDKELYKRYDVE